MRQTNKQENEPTVDFHKEQGEAIRIIQEQIKAVDEAIEQELKS
jgi:hypothetical protein